MGDDSQIIEIILFAAVAGFLLLRLRSVLGRRTGNEQRRDPFAPPAPPVVPLAAPPVPDNRVLPFPGAAPAPGLSGTAAIKAADPAFTEDGFLHGARGAFEIIVNAFAAGDTAALKPLLSKDVFDQFDAAIRQRLAAKETVQTTLVAIKAAEILGAVVEGSTALVTTRFVSDQVNVTHAADGRVLDGDGDRIAEHDDHWVFARPLRSRDPNWTLVATHAP